MRSYVHLTYLRLIIIRDIFFYPCNGDNVMLSDNYWSQRQAIIIVPQFNLNDTSRPSHFFKSLFCLSIQCFYCQVSRADWFDRSVRAIMSRWSLHQCADTGTYTNTSVQLSNDESRPCLALPNNDVPLCSFSLFAAC